MDTIKVTFGPDVQFVTGTATVPFRLTSSTLRVNGKAPSTRKGDTVPTLRLTAAQLAALKAAGPGIVKAGAVVLPASQGRGRPRKAGAALSSLWAEPTVKATGKAHAVKATE